MHILGSFYGAENLVSQLHALIIGALTHTVVFNIEHKKKIVLKAQFEDVAYCKL